MREGKRKGDTQGKKGRRGSEEGGGEYAEGFMWGEREKKVKK